MEKFLELVWKVLNTPAVITALAGLILFILNKVYAKKPGWMKYEGAIISGVKFAEKAIPDNSENKSLFRLNQALQYVIKVYENRTGKEPSKAVKAEMLEGIQIVHNELESEGLLGKK